MINSFTRKFDYSDFEKRLKHYFTDSAPINADIVIGLREVGISCGSGIPVSCRIDEYLDTKKNVERVINACIKSLFPKMIVAEEKYFPFSEEQKKSLLMQGFSIEQIIIKEKKRIWDRYVLIRFNEYESTVDYVKESTGTRYRAHLYQPLTLIKDKIWKLAEEGREGMEKLYRFIISESKQEILEREKVGCDIQES
jgi:hypothetical protein